MGNSPQPGELRLTHLINYSPPRFSCAVPFTLSGETRALLGRWYIYQCCFVLFCFLEIIGGGRKSSLYVVIHVVRYNFGTL